MTITEFLLARIADDEDEMQGLPHFGCVEGDSDPVGMIHSARCPNRVLAECAAKRRIIEGYIEFDAAYPDSPVWHGCGDDCEFKAIEWVLAHLASVYADHPDFDPAWA